MLASSVVAAVCCAGVVWGAGCDAGSPSGRGCAAFHAYQRINVGRVDQTRVVELLLTHPAVPRSTRFCLEAGTKALSDMIGERPRRVESKPERLLGRALSDLRYADLGSMIGTSDLHPFLGDLIRRCGEVSVAAQEQYSV